MYTPKNAPARYHGIIVARAIATGDVALARRLAAGRTSWRVPELRAITGAASYLVRAFGAPDVSRSILGWM